MKIEYPTLWKDYELIDSGDFEKLERFGKYITIRPEPQAVWEKSLSDQEWVKQSDISFEAKSSSKGIWKKRNKQMPDQWVINYSYKDASINLRMGLTSFKHVGVFPEQAANWNFIYEQIKSSKIETPTVLNMFAYTGAASIMAKAAGADVIHLDSIKQVVTWAKQNQELSQLDGVRWMVEDAMKFAKRCVKRGTKFNGIILDPPAFGHGPNGENWKLERDIGDMVEAVLEILDPEDHFLVLNTYSLGFSALILENILKKLGYKGDIEVGELCLNAKENHLLPLGVFARCKSKSNNK